jgi:hypothetical protein
VRAAIAYRQQPIASSRSIFHWRSTARKPRGSWRLGLRKGETDELSDRKTSSGGGDRSAYR